MDCFYKKTFLKDLASIPEIYQKRIERIVFKEIPKSENVNYIKNMKKMRSYDNYYRIRVGSYRIGCILKTKNTIVFYRVKNRKDIYKLFP
jgi:mRNA interferase RelE/StbE